MYIRCQEGDTQYIVDTEGKKVYEVMGDNAVLLKTEADNFMRWHPYLEEIETTDRKPKEIK